MAFVVYQLTLAPGLTWAHNGADGGDFLAAALTGGVPHPPGYPTYQLLLRAAIAAVPDNPAVAGNVLSALSGALAVVLLADLAWRLLPDTPWRSPVAVLAALSWAFSPSLWSQAIITEAYTLNALCVIAILWALVRARQTSVLRNQLGWLVGGGLALGIGAGNHLTLLLMLPAIAILGLENRRSAIKSGPARFVAFAASTIVGCAVYFYLPLAARTDPPINWGDPSTPERLWWVVSGHLYRGLVFGVELGSLPSRIASWVAAAVRQFGGAWGALIALLGLWQMDQRHHLWWRVTGAVALSYTIYAIGYDTADSYVYLVPVWGMAAIWLAFGMDELLRAMAAGLARIRARGHLSQALVSGATAGGLAVLALLHPAASLAGNWTAMNLRHENQAGEFVEAVLDQALPNSVLLTSSDRTTFALWYELYGLRRRTDLIPINVSLYSYEWYRRTLLSHHPELVDHAVLEGNDLPLLGDLIHGQSETSAIYRVEPLQIRITGFREESSGTLVRLIEE